MQTLAILDWGIGGLGIYRSVKARLGAVPVLYFSDAGATPYGQMSKDELSARLDAVSEFLRARGASHLVIGCNAASTVLPNWDARGLEIEGVIAGALDAVEIARPTKLAVMGGARTIRSGFYRRELARRGYEVRQRIAQPLSALIENGDVDSATLHQVARQITAPMRDASHILLACTHYPAALTVLRRYASPATVFIDPAATVAEKIARWNLLQNAARSDVFFTTGDPQRMKFAAHKAFEVEIETVQKIIL